MTNANYTTTATPQLTISCHADLQIIGTPDNVVVIDIDDNSPASRIDRQDDVILVTAVSDCDITCPIGATLTIEHASGDLRVTQVKGALAVNAVNGDAALHDVGPTAIKTVQGDLSAARCQRRRADRCRARRRETQARGRQRGHQQSRGRSRRQRSGRRTGDQQRRRRRLAARRSLIAGQSYVVKAGGDVIFRVEGGGGQFALNCKGDLRVRLPMTNWTGNERSATGTYGDGSAQVTLMANGDLLVLPGTAGAPWDPDLLVRASGNDDRIGDEPVRNTDVQSAA